MYFPVSADKTLAVHMQNAPLCLNVQLLEKRILVLQIAKYKLLLKYFLNWIVSYCFD